MPSATARPNVLFVMMDQLQARALGCYGNSVVHTPHLDALAAAGVLFERHFVQQALCVPSRCSLFTGRYVHAHGHTGNDSLLRPDEPHLGSLLHAAGYFTGYAGKNHLIPDERGKQDFDYWRGWPNEQMARLREPRQDGEVPPEPPAPTPERPWPTAFYVGRGTVPAAAERDALATDAALEFLEQRPTAVGGPTSDRPFALIVSYRGPHPPYAAPPEFYGRHSREQIAAPLAPPGCVEGKPPWVASFRRFYRYDEMRPEDVREIVATYYDHLAFLDYEVGRLLRRLEKRGLRQNTLIVFTADHGDYAGELGLFEKHAFDFYDTLLHVPLILSWPGSIPSGEHRRGLVASVDVVPTLLDLCGVAAVEGVQGHTVRGVIEEAQAGPRDAVFAEACGPAGNVPAGGIHWHRLRAIADLPQPWPGAMVRTDDWKLCWRPMGLHELYHLPSDPLEHTNLAGHPEHQATQRALEQRLLTWLIECQSPRDRQPARGKGSK